MILARLLRTSNGVPAESQIQEFFCLYVKFDQKISISVDTFHPWPKYFGYLGLNFKIGNTLIYILRHLQCSVYRDLLLTE